MEENTRRKTKRGGEETPALARALRATTCGTQTSPADNASSTATNPVMSRGKKPSAPPKAETPAQKHAQKFRMRLICKFWHAANSVVQACCAESTPMIPLLPMVYLHVVRALHPSKVT
jgi:hypothetical protein